MMAIKNILTCDRCGAECKFDTIYVQCSSNGCEQTTEPLDLCYPCLRRAVDLVLKKETGWLPLFKEPMKVVRV